MQAHLVLDTVLVNELQTTTWELSLAFLGICDALVLNGADAEHLRHQPVKFVKTAP